MKKAVKSLAKKMGYEIKKPNDKIGSNGVPKDITDEIFIGIYNQCKDFSTCSIEPMYNLYKSPVGARRDAVSAKNDEIKMV